MQEQSNFTSNTDTDTKFIDEGMTESGTANEKVMLNNDAQLNNSQTADVNKHSLGKFKNIEELQKAYKSLEAEFTKRSQKLKEYENTTISWEDKVDKFLDKNPTAKDYAQDIYEEISNDDNLINMDNCLEIAFSRALEKKIVPYDKLVSNSEFLDKYIYSNKQVTDKIIENYLSNLKNYSPVKLMGDGGQFAISSKNRPKSIKDCGELVEKMFN